MYKHLQVGLSLLNGLLNKVPAATKVLKGVFLFLLLFTFQNSFSQTYPITASFQIIPPYNVYLPDYCVPGSDKIRVILLQNDLTVPSYEVRLRMTIEWNGSIIMHTSPNFNPSPITLSAGAPNLVSGNDLCIYFNTDAIDFSGYSRENYERTKTLPEGAYRISFTAYDYRRQNVQVSNVGSNIFFLQKKDPPLLNSPSCNIRIPKQDPQFITFNWSSVNIPSLPGNETEYTFSLYEIKPKNSDPNYIIRSSAPVFTTVTKNNILSYGPGEPALLDSMEYVWRVQARSSDGRDLYSNQGYSIPCKFRYGGADPFANNNLPRPTVFAKPLHERAAKVWWHPARQQNIVESYRIEYRGSTNSLGEFPWHTEERESDTTLTISSLEPEREYEVRSSWKVHGVYGPYSEVVKFTTPKPKKFECGTNTAPTVPANQAPLQSANVGMTVKIGSLDITLLEVSGSNGTFSGKGKIANNGFLHGLRMIFSDIYINTDLIVTRGEMQADAEPIEGYVGEKVEKQHKVDTYKKFADKIQDENTPLQELQEFAKALIEIPQDRIDKAIALTREEKQQIETAREKAKEAMKTLNDPKATAEEKKEAEKNLRKAVADAKPALDKLANTLDRGIQTVVGRWFKKVMDFLNAYKGNESDKKQAIVWHSKMDSTVNVLSQRTDVPADLKKAMVDAHQNAKTAWTSLEKGTDGIRPKGPSADFEEGHTPEDIVLCKTNVETAEAVEKYVSIEEPKIKCVAGNANLGKLFVAPDSSNILLGSNDIPLAFFAEEEGKLYGRLAAFKRNEKTFIYYLNNSTKEYSGLWGDINLGNQDVATNLIAIPPSDTKGVLVTTEASNTCAFKITYTENNKSFKAGGKPKNKEGKKKVSNDFAKDYSDDCKNELFINSGYDNLLTIINSKSSVKDDDLVKTINTVCKTSILKLTYTQIVKLFRQLASSSSIKEQQELAILRLMSCIAVANYETFYTLLESENCKLLRNLIEQIDDASIYYWDKNNYTNFIGALCRMFKFDNRVAKIAEEGSPNLLGTIISLVPVKFKTTSWYSTGDKSFGSSYNNSTGAITVFEQEEIIVNGVTGWVQMGDPFPPLSPLSPVIVVFEKNELPLVQTALSDAGNIAAATYVVPAIFLKYRRDKITKEAIEKTGMITLDLVTIYASGGTVLATKVTWARRLWAMGEVAGAAGNIGLNLSVIDTTTNFGKALGYYNIAMALIGVKNLGRGLYHYAKELPEQTKNLLKSNGNLRTLLQGNYQKFKASSARAKAEANYADLNAPDKTKLRDAEEMFDALMGGAKVGKVFKVGDDIAGITIKQIKTGTNKKYALIGRSMGNAEITGIRNIYAELKGVQKLDIEIFDALSLTGSWKARFDDAVAEFAAKTNNWTSKLSNQELLQLKIYKLNKEWAQHLIEDGYTILDMGDFNNLGFSAFYAMEKSTIFK